MLVRDAYISNDPRYRYWLTRVWDESLPVVVWMMLNPSTADAFADDATMRRCMAYAKAWGYGGIAVVNVYAFRARSPKVMLAADDPVGPHNDRWLIFWWEQARRTGAPIVCGWGNNAREGRVRSVLRLAQECGIMLHALEMGKFAPKHPLYLRNGLTPIPLRMP